MSAFTPFIRVACVSAVLCAVAIPAVAAELVSKPEAEAMVKKAVAFMKANGREKSYAEFNNKAGKFTDRDLYMVVYGMDGMVYSHGANPKMINKNLIDIKDVDGKAFVRERVDLGKKGAPFWQEYKFINPVSGKIEPKAMYCQPVQDVIVCGGVYLK